MFRRRVRRRLAAVSVGVVGLLGVGASVVALSATSAPPPASERSVEYLKTHATVTPSTEPPRPVLAVVGDSFAMDRTDAWPARTAFCTGHRLVMSGFGGSGFWNPGKGGKRYGDPARVPVVTKHSPDIIILESAYNDSFRAETMADTLEGHIVETIEAYKKAAPKAKIILVGPMWAIEPPTVGIKNNSAALASAAKKTGVPHLNGIGWMPTAEYTVADLKHPNAKGHIQITAALVDSLKANGLIESTGGCGAS